MVNQHYKAYAQATQTVAKTKQIVMLYDGAIRFVQQAKEAIRERRIEDRYHLLLRASEIISGLQGALDFEQGGNIAKLLYNFYSSVESRIFSVHHTNSIETCDSIIDDLKQMRDVWREIDQGEATQATQVTQAAPPAGKASSGEEPPVGPNGKNPPTVTLSA